MNSIYLTKVPRKYWPKDDELDSLCQRCYRYDKCGAIKTKSITAGDYIRQCLNEMYLAPVVNGTVPYPAIISEKE